MSVETESKKSWTPDSLQQALRKGTVVLKVNTDGKVDCWKKFKLVENSDGQSMFVWAACADCLCCIVYESKTPDGTVELYTR
jgi:hypothetical protein